MNSVPNSIDDEIGGFFIYSGMYIISSFVLMAASICGLAFNLGTPKSWLERPTAASTYFNHWGMWEVKTHNR